MVCGSPASGKSTFARHVDGALRNNIELSAQLGGYADEGGMGPFSSVLSASIDYEARPGTYWVSKDEIKEHLFDDLVRDRRGAEYVAQLLRSSFQGLLVQLAGALMEIASFDSVHDFTRAHGEILSQVSLWRLGRYVTQAKGPLIVESDFVSQSLNELASVIGPGSRRPEFFVQMDCPWPTLLDRYAKRSVSDRHRVHLDVPLNDVDEPTIAILQRLSFELPTLFQPEPPDTWHRLVVPGDKAVLDWSAPTLVSNLLHHLGYHSLVPEPAVHDSSPEPLIDQWWSVEAR